MARTKTKKSEFLNCRLDKSTSDKLNEIVTDCNRGRSYKGQDGREGCREVL